MNTDGSLTMGGQPVSNLAGKVAGTVRLLEGAIPSSSKAMASTPEKDPLVKRRKQQVDEEMIKLQAMEAASLEESLRAQ